VTGDGSLTAENGWPTLESDVMKKKILLLMTLIILVLAACSTASEPRMIAAHPAGEVPIAVYPIEPPVGPIPPVVYSASLDLKVGNLDHAVERAMSLAYENGGYLVSSQSWYQEDEKRTTLVLAVPADRFDAMHNGLLNLGSLVSEQVYGELLPYDNRGWETFSHITVNLRPRGWSLPSVDVPDLRPAHTFVQAWQVFTAIFGFLLDVVIWIVVVVGPFVLMGWGLIKLLQWRKK
jgi:hypothetical protein